LFFHSNGFHNMPLFTAWQSATNKFNGLMPCV
jgi:hypothetical protein